MRITLNAFGKCISLSLLVDDDDEYYDEDDSSEYEVMGFSPRR